MLLHTCLFHICKKILHHGLAQFFPLDKYEKMVNEKQHISAENPLRQWRKQIEPPLTIQSAAARAGVSAHCWWAWEMWPSAKGKMPSPENWQVLHRVTNGVVSSNDYIELMGIAA